MSYFLFLNKLYNDNKINIHNYGKHKRDFSHIDLIVEVYSKF